MSEPLRPSTLSEILDRTVHFYRSRFLVFLGISVVPTVVVLVLAGGIIGTSVWWDKYSTASFSPAVAVVLTAVFVAAIVLAAVPAYLAATALSSAALNHAASCAVLDEPFTIRDAYKTVGRRGWRYLGLYVLEGLIVWGIPLAVWTALVFLSTAGAFLVKMAGMSGVTGGTLFGLGIFLVVVALVGYCIWMLLRLSLAFPACVVEQIGVIAALRRSGLLSVGTKGRIFLLYLLGLVLSWIVSIGLMIPMSIIVALLPGSTSPQHAQTAAVVMAIVMYGATFAVQAFIKPIFGIALMLFYYDQRIRIEGFDIEWMMLRAGLAPAVTPASEPPHTIDAGASERTIEES
jgi:hypothetical protein